MEERKFLLRKLCQFDPQTEAEVQKAISAKFPQPTAIPSDKKGKKKNSEPGTTGEREPKRNTGIRLSLWCCRTQTKVPAIVQNQQEARAAATPRPRRPSHISNSTGKPHRPLARRCHPRSPRVSLRRLNIPRRLRLDPHLRRHSGPHRQLPLHLQNFGHQRHAAL